MPCNVSIKKFEKKFGGLEKSAYLCNRFEREKARKSSSIAQLVRAPDC